MYPSLNNNNALYPVGGAPMMTMPTPMMTNPTPPPMWPHPGGYPPVPQQPLLPLRVYFTNVPVTMSPETFADTLSKKYGALMNVTIITDAQGHPNGQALAECYNMEQFQGVLASPTAVLPEGTVVNVSAHPPGRPVYGGGPMMMGVGPAVPPHHRGIAGGAPIPTSTDVYSKQQREVEGETATYVVVRCLDVDVMLYSCDIGWWPLDPVVAAEVQEIFSRSTPEVPRPVVLIVLCEPKQRYIGYMYMTGNVSRRSEVVASEGRDLPTNWEMVCRVSWSRVGPLSLESVRQHAALSEDDRRLLLTAPDGCTLQHSLGVRLCSMIDESAAVKVLPNRERMKLSTGLYGGGGAGSAHSIGGGVGMSEGAPMHSGLYGGPPLQGGYALY